MSLRFEHDVVLAGRTTLGVGGGARHWLDAPDERTLVEALGWANEHGRGVVVLGGGSNVLVADRGLDALVVRPTMRQLEASTDGQHVVVDVGAGVVWDELVAWAVAHDLAGLECLSGIPGDSGAAPIQNIGAYGQELAGVVDRVRVVDRATGRSEELSGSACGFGYRDSVFKHALRDRCVVVGLRLRFARGAPPTLAYAELQRAFDGEGGEPTLASVRQMVLALRGKKSMLLDPQDENRRSAGSFFVNPTLTAAELNALHALVDEPDVLPTFPAGGGRTKVPAAWLIEHAGLTKGSGDGPVGISTRHTLAIVNRGGATAADVVRFASAVRRRVLERFGVRLTPEPRLLGFEPDEIADLVDAAAGASGTG